MRHAGMVHLNLLSVAARAHNHRRVPPFGGCTRIRARVRFVDMRRAIFSRNRAALRLLLEVAIMVGAYVAYEAVRRLVAADSGDAVGHASRIIRVEQQLGIFFEPSLQAMIVDHDWLVTLFNWVYVWGYLP